MTNSGTPNEERSAEEELVDTALGGPESGAGAGAEADPPRQETTIRDAEQVLEEFGEDVASSPAQRAQPTPGPPVRSEQPK